MAAAAGETTVLRIAKVDVERRLRRPGTRPGTWLFRPSDRNPEEVVLSVAVPAHAKRVRHFRVYSAASPDPGASGVFLFRDSVFPSLPALIESYRQQQHPTVGVALTGRLQLHQPRAPLHPKTTFRDIGLGGSIPAARPTLLGRVGHDPITVQMVSFGAPGVQDIIKRAQKLTKLTHENVCQFLGVITTPDKLWLCYEQTAQSLRTLIDNHGRELSYNQKLDFAAQIAGGMRFLEQRKLFHGCLSSLQILLNAQKHCLVVGVCTNELSQQAIVDFEQVRWASPECVRSGTFGIKGDVWAFGVIVWELWTTGLPFGTKSPAQIQELLLSSDVSLQLPDDVPVEIRDSVLACFHRTPSQRPVFKFLHTLVTDTLYSFFRRPSAQIQASVRAPAPPQAAPKRRSSTSSVPTGPSGKAPAPMAPTATKAPAPRHAHTLQRMASEDLARRPPPLHPTNPFGIERPAQAVGKTLHGATRKRDLALMTQLLNSDADPNGLNENGETALQIAVGNSDFDCTRVLLAYSASINIADKNGQTPLHVAIVRKCPKVARVLILSGADQAIRDKNGRRAKDLAWTHPGEYVRDAECEVDNALVLADVWSCCNSFEELSPGCERDQAMLILLDPEEEEENEAESLEELGPNAADPFPAGSIDAADESQYQNLDAIVRPELLTLGDELGDGNFGKVYKAFWNCGGEVVQVAIKTMKQDSSPEFDHEALVLKSMQHQHIVEFVGVCRKVPTLDLMGIVTEFAPGGELLAHLVKCGTAIPIGRLVLFASQICDAMTYLESRKILHRDLSARNVLLSRPECVKIADFGLSRVIQSGSYYRHTNSKMAWPWTAPECYTAHRVSHKSDVWSFGITMFELFSPTPRPWAEARASEYLELLEMGIRPKKPERCPSVIYDIMTGCWKWDGPQGCCDTGDCDCRPSFETLNSRLHELLRFAK